MAHFYGTLRGNRGEVTRCGSKSSGVRATVNGWNFGGYAYISHAEEHGDIVSLYVDGGSNGSRESLHILTASESDTPKDIARKLREAAEIIERKTTGYGASGWPED